MNNVSIGCKLGSCPSGPTASILDQEWMLADGTLISTRTWPANRFGAVEKVRLYRWLRDGSTKELFRDAHTDGLSHRDAIRWLEERGAVELADWPRSMPYVDHIGISQVWRETLREPMAALISAWYDVRGIDLPVCEESFVERWRREDREHLEKLQRNAKPSKRIVGGTRRRRNARRRVNR